MVRLGMGCLEMQETRQQRTHHSEEVVGWKRGLDMTTWATVQGSE